MRRESEADSWTFEGTLAAVARSAAARRPATSKAAWGKKRGLRSISNGRKLGNARGEGSERLGLCGNARGGREKRGPAQAGDVEGCMGGKSRG